VLATEFLELMNIGISELAEAMGLERNTLSRIAHDKGALTTPTAIKLEAAQGFLFSTATWVARKR
jgi:addiction module HigA family antidote